MLAPDIEEKIIGSAEILEIFKVSKVGKVAGSKVTEGEIVQDSKARIIRDGTIIFNGKIGSIFREKNQAKQVSTGQECGITLKDFNDYQTLFALKEGAVAAPTAGLHFTKKLISKLIHKLKLLKMKSCLLKENMLISSLMIKKSVGLEK